MSSQHKRISLVRWSARLLAGAAFLFWGGFFLEHLREWFIEPLPKTPPPKVWISQLLHLAMLISYPLAIKWEARGGLLIIATSLLFFTHIGLSLTASSITYVGLSILPGILFLITSRLTNNQQHG